MPSYVYALTDPETGAICYVGKSDNPIHRHYQHVMAIQDDDFSKRAEWLRALRVVHRMPGVRILEEADAEHVIEAERNWILKLHAEGVALVNDIHVPRQRPVKPKTEFIRPSEGSLPGHSMEPGDYVTIPEAAALLSVTDAAVRKAIQKKRMDATIFFGRKLISRADLAAYIARTQPNGEKPKGRPAGSKNKEKRVDV